MPVELVVVSVSILFERIRSFASVCAIVYTLVVAAFVAREVVSAAKLAALLVFAVARSVLLALVANKLFASDIV